MAELGPCMRTFVCDSRGILESGTREALESWICETQKSWTCEALKSWICEALESQTYEIMRSETCEIRESWYAEVFMNEGFGNQEEAKSKSLPQKSGFGVWTSGKLVNVWNQPRKSQDVKDIHVHVHTRNIP
jgi:hypothetical protein